MVRLVKIRDVEIYRDGRYYCGPGPSAALLPDGRILAAFRRARSWTGEKVFAHGFPSTEACLAHSDDNGLSWSAPRVFAAGNITNQNLTRLPDGSLLCLTQRGELVPLKVYRRLKDLKPLQYDENFGWAYASHGVQALRSDDGGLSWEGPFFLTPVPGIDPILPGWPSPAGLRASAVALGDEVGVAVYGIRGVERRDANVWFMVSADRGESWEPRGCIIDEPEAGLYPNETAVYPCASGKIVAFMRVEYGAGGLYTAESGDGGRTWSAPVPRGVKGHPFQAARLACGRVLLAYGYRHEPMGVRARLLDPECDGVEGAAELVLRADGHSFDLGYPHVLPMPDGTALVSYYHNDADGTRHVAGTLVGVQE